MKKKIIIVLVVLLAGGGFVAKSMFLKPAVAKEKIAGTIYIHSCESTGLSATCSFPTGAVNSSNSNYFRDSFALGGGSGSQSYVLGEIIVDNLVLQGGGSIYMDLNPSTVNNIYKAALYQ